VPRDPVTSVDRGALAGRNLVRGYVYLSHLSQSQTSRKARLTGRLSRAIFTVEAMPDLRSQTTADSVRKHIASVCSADLPVQTCEEGC
jgi:hypothetical protein